MTKLEMTFLTKSMGEKVSSRRAEQAAVGAASCTGTGSPPPRRGGGGLGRRGEQMPSAISPHKQIAVLRKQKPISP